MPITVLVEVLTPLSTFLDDEDCYEVIIIQGYNELQQIMEKLKERSSTLRDKLSSSECVFKCESDVVPGRYVVIGDDCHLKHGSTLKCVVRPKNLNSTFIEGLF